MSKSGTLFVVAAPSGAGKTSLVRGVVESVENIQVSVSHTTRAPRPDDQDGVDYFYISDDIFSKMVSDQLFLEHAEVFGNHYGTSKRTVMDSLSQGVDVILEIDWQGGRQIRQIFPDSVSIYILPPSLDELQARLFARNQDSAEVIALRMSEARHEMSHYHEFDYVIFNDDFDRSLQEFCSIVIANRHKTRIQEKNHKKLLAELTQSS